MSTVTTAQPATTGCGCGSGGGCGGGCQGACGGAASQASAFIRPNFFAGQLLTEDDLQALTGYVTGKRRLTNRLVFGPGVVCGLEVVCDPCGGGKVTVRPGYALDCCGNDIVLDCPESVDVNALIRDLRIRSLGVDCGEDCGEGTDANGRQYQLYVRYTEQPTDPIAPYPTGEPCSSSDCSPSRIRETFTFVIKCGTPASHRYDPGDFLTARFGAMDALSAVYNGDRHLAPYVAPLRNTVAAAGTTVTFDDAAVQQLTTATGAVNDLLNQVGQQSLTPPQAQDLTERVRVLASSVARYLVSDQSSKVSLTEAQQALDQATTKLNGTDTITVWDDQLRAELATALISEVRARLLPSGAAAAAPLETRMLAQGAPLSYDLRRSINAGLNTQWQWLLVRLDTSGGVSDCATSGTVAGITLPPALPPPQDGQGPHPTTAELSTTADALEKLHAALLGYLADSACASLHPPCGDCAQTDLLLAEVTVRDCTVVEICTSGREQVLPGGSGYAGWLPTLYQARPLAEQVCCQPMVAPPGQPDPQLPYLPGLFRQPPLTPLDQLLALLLPAVGG
ncbi:MAG: hypothetical protein J2P15_19130, partial [Micromonosporaceae bacterium]|nr:hypothetical protein [Micromonosporaceae bacterium]